MKHIHAMRKQRCIVTYITGYLWDSGIVIVLSLLISEWLKKDCHIVLVCSDENGEDGSRIRAAFPHECEINILSLDNMNAPQRMLCKLKTMRAIIHKYPKAVYLSLFNEGTRLFSICKLVWHIKVVFAERNDPRKSPPSKKRRIIRDICFLLADRCIFQTDKIKGDFPPVVQKKSRVIYNPVSTALPSRCMGPKRKVFVAVGRLSRQKNYPLLLDAFRMFSEEYPEYSLEIYGDGEEETNLAKLCDQYDLKDRVRFMGYVENVSSKTVDATGFVMSSDYEGLSNAMLEALCVGLPVLCTDYLSGGARLVIQNEINGILVPTGDAKAIYRGMKRIVSEEGFADSISKEAVKVKERFKAERIAGEWLSVLFPENSKIG